MPARDPGVSPWRPGQPLALDTTRFHLRSLTAADASATYIGWWNDPEIQAGLGQRARGWGRTEAQKHIARFDNRLRFHLGIFPHGEPLPIGFIAAFIEPAGRARTNTVIGEKRYWGAGVVIEVRARVLEFLFEVIGVHKVYGEVDGRNFASVFNYKAQGFTREGVLREHLAGPDGERHDRVVFGLLRAEWLAARRTAAPASSTP
jgi:RimJ/RimL family protein N-acetyltransferase